jgi:gas vesicle protein
MSYKNDNQSIILSFIIGAATGLAAGILMAPEAGQETRRTIAKKATNIKDQATSQFNTIKGQVGNQINKISKSGKTDTLQNGKKGNTGTRPSGSGQPNVNTVG